jgi:hypothetical protein
MVWRTFISALKTRYVAVQGLGELQFKIRNDAEADRGTLLQNRRGKGKEEEGRGGEGKGNKSVDVCGVSSKLEASMLLMKGLWSRF